MSNNDHLSHVGPITRSVADAALMLRVMAGPDDRTRAAWNHRHRTTSPASTKAFRVCASPTARISATCGGSGGGRGGRCRGAGLRGLGYPVEEVDPGWGDRTEMEHCFWTSMIAGNAGPFVAEWGDRMDPGLLACIEEGHRYSAVDYFLHRAERNALYRQVREFFERYDLLLTPTLSVAAFPAHRLVPEHWEQHPWDWIRWAGFSYPFNLTWMPAASCPCGFTPDGRPVGLQIVAGRFQDLRVLQASRVFEQALPLGAAAPTLAGSRSPARASLRRPRSISVAAPRTSEDPRRSLHRAQTRCRCTGHRSGRPAPGSGAHSGDRLGAPVGHQDEKGHRGE